MKVTFFWPDCDFQNMVWHCEPIDSFVVVVTPEELNTKIRSYITVAYEEKIENKSPHFDSDGNAWFHITRDLKSVVPIAWYYPISNMWNGWSPFRPFEAEIESLEDLFRLNLQI